MNLNTVTLIFALAFIAFVLGVGLLFAKYCGAGFSYWWPASILIVSSPVVGVLLWMIAKLFGWGK